MQLRRSLSKAVRQRRIKFAAMGKGGYAARCVCHTADNISTPMAQHEQTLVKGIKNGVAGLSKVKPSVTLALLAWFTGLALLHYEFRVMDGRETSRTVTCQTASLIPKKRDWPASRNSTQATAGTA